MAEQAQARMLSAAFPTPPPYYKHFTKQNVTKVRQIRKEAATNSDQVDVGSLPADLRYLIPPEPPADGRYKSFGAQHDLAQPAQSLAQAGIQELFPADAAHLDPTPHLQTLTRAVLLNFLELVGTLSVNPTQGPEKVEHLQTLFYNLHDLINRYRPHQARESLIMTMEDQLDKIKAQVKSVNSVKDRMEQVLSDIRVQATSETANTPAKQEKPSASETAQPTDTIQKAMYDALKFDLDD
ncbi:mediator of RNA polymerase II transcription subunit 7 [Aureobasidium pullulans]|uniref:Mediator of RNA polymerase II transcription subunit 7 n=1 Tax=Aureobasidium pullulans TaxID=5580 RepID=A0A4S9THR0_AURPU|nr:mediator of RNA polymerase II transcription subunit 7 [Aureobasidium pullulans]